MNSSNQQTSNLLVRASAGSGKTFQLTNRYIKCVLEGEDPAGLLATTFTRAAAGEILHRVLLRLSQAVTVPSARNQLCDALDLDQLTTSQCSESLQTIIQSFPRLSVMTIDSLFSRMATAYAPDLGLPLSYRMIPEDEDVLIRDDCIDEAIQQCSIPEMYTFLRSLQGQRVQMNTHAAITKLTTAAYSMYLASKGNESAWDSINPVGTPIPKNTLDQLLNDLQNAPVALTKSNAPHKSWVTALQNSIELITHSDWHKFLAAGFPNKILLAEKTGDPPLYSNVPFPDQLLDALRPFIEHAKYAITSEHIEATRATYSLMKRFDDTYHAAKLSSGQLSFEDPPRLLEESMVTGDLEHLYYRLDSSIRHVMLDEFQDTSIPQFNLLRPILDEVLSQDENGRSAFIVGDAKQSLYSWREAEPKLLGAVKDHWTTLKEKPLYQSWRSSPIILETVNAVFDTLTQNASLMDQPIGSQTALAWDAEFDTHEAAKPELQGIAQLIVANEDPDQLGDSTNEVLWECASRVAEARSQCDSASIAVLVRQGKHIYPLLSMLKKLGIDACEDRGNPLVDAPCVAALVSFLKVIDHPGDTAALHHVLTSPIAPAVGLKDASDIHEIAAQYRMRLATESCTPILSELLECCAESMDARSFTRFEQCIELAAQLESEGRGGPATLASVAQSRRIDDPGQATVRVITIHRSKGLEFDCVVMPLLGKQWNLMPNSMIAARDQQLGPISHITKYPNTVLRAVHPVLDRMYSYAMQRQINEELCCLYVAMTRPKHSLQMIIPATKDGRSGKPESKLSLKPADVIYAALSSDLPREPGDIIYESSSTGQWHESIKPNGSIEQSLNVKHEPLEFSVEPASTMKTGLHTSLAPSAQGNESTIDAASLINTDSITTESQAFGDQVHNLFRKVEWIPEPATTDWMLEELSESNAHHDTDHALKEVINTLNSIHARKIFMKDLWLSENQECTSVTVYNERPFAVRNQSTPSQLIQGRIDRLSIGFNAQGPCTAQIIDYKTDRAARGLTNDELREYASKHAKQLFAYRDAVAEIYSIDVSAVETILIYTANPSVVSL